MILVRKHSIYQKHEKMMTKIKSTHFSCRHTKLINKSYFSYPCSNHFSPPRNLSLVTIWLKPYMSKGTAQFEVQNVLFVMLMYSVHVKELLNNFVSSRLLGESHHWFRLTFASLFLPSLLLPPSHSSHNSSVLDMQHVTSSLSLDMLELPSTFSAKSVCLEGIILFLSPEFHISFYFNLMLLAALMKAVHNSQLCDFAPSQYCEFVLLEKCGFSLPHP